MPNIATSSVLWLPLTVGAFWLSTEVYRRAGKTPLLNPTMLTIGAVCLTLVGLGVPHADYFESVAVLHYLLGTAVVALAVPLHLHLRNLSGQLPRMLVALAVGSFTSIVCGLIIAKALGASQSALLALAPKSATAAVSMEIAQGVGGYPALTGCITILTGITGAVIGPYILNWTGVFSPSARGVALGTASHGIATARAFGECEVTGCCATVAMGLNAILTAILVPAVIVAFRFAEK